MWKIYTKPYQEKFLLSKKRFPALVAAIGTGKTMMLLMKIKAFCDEYPNTLALIVRKEYTDLRDSTIKDFESYFGESISSSKDYKAPNGSVIMFRHGSELNVLKNINLTIVGIEQAEEFETDEIFTFLRDRLRRDNAPLRQLCIIGNVNGHNWIWKLWKNNPANEDFDLQEATTFENEDNLPQDFVNDLRRMETEAPNHYRRYVLNDWEEAGGDDYLFTWHGLNKSINLEMPNKDGDKIIGCDPARFGEDETAFALIQNRGFLLWEQKYSNGYKKKDLMWSVGRAIDLKRETQSRFIAVDDVAVGGGVTDRLKEMNISVCRFLGGEKPNNDKFYANKRTEAFFMLKDLIDKEHLKILKDDILIDQLLTIRYKYNSKGQKLLVSKDDMRKDGIKSPDRADALSMACYFIHRATRTSQALPQQTIAPKMY